jgi:cation diffusion facilitator CzcD-associated flavoprotein CzcO
VGAGISGIGSAYHLQDQCPDKTYAVLEMKDTFGGTWDTHKYPGVRSDSDLYTFGYRFKPWVGAPVASGAEILKYLGEVITENGIDRHIRYGTRIVSCTRAITTMKRPMFLTGKAFPITRGSSSMPRCGIRRPTLRASGFW